MAVVYPDDIKAARMTAVKDALGVDGKLEIGTTGTATLIATDPLGSGGSVAGSGAGRCGQLDVVYSCWPRTGPDRIRRVYGFGSRRRNRGCRR